VRYYKGKCGPDTRTGTLAPAKAGPFSKLHVLFTWRRVAVRARGVQSRSVAVIRIRFEVIPDVSRFLKSAKRGTLRNFALELKLTLYRPGCRPDYRPMPLRERLICAVLLGKNAYEIRVAAFGCACCLSGYFGGGSAMLRPPLQPRQKHCARRNWICSYKRMANILTDFIEPPFVIIDNWQ
jgi:hypothetical protein